MGIAPNKQQAQGVPGSTQVKTKVPDNSAQIALLIDDLELYTTSLPEAVRGMYLKQIVNLRSATSPMR